MEGLTIPPPLDLLCDNVIRECVCVVGGGGGGGFEVNLDTTLLYLR